MDAINISTHFSGRHAAVGSRHSPEQGGGSDVESDQKRLLEEGKERQGRGERQGQRRGGDLIRFVKIQGLLHKRCYYES